MKVLFIHGDVCWKLAKRQKSKGSKMFLPLVESPEGNMANAIIAKIHLSKGDEKIKKDIIIEEFHKAIALLKSESIALLPFAHLDEDTSITMDALRALGYLSELKAKLSEVFGIEVALIPFGVEKELTIRFKAHKYSAHFREFLPGD